MFSYSLRELSATEILDCIQKNIPFFSFFKKVSEKENSAVNCVISVQT